MTAMGRHAESPGVQEEAAGALGNIAANHPENQRKIGAQVANAHEYICALPEENDAIGNRKHTHTRTHTHTGGDRGLGDGDGPEPFCGLARERVSTTLSAFPTYSSASSGRGLGRPCGAPWRPWRGAPGATADTKTWGQKVLDALKNV